MFWLRLGRSTNQKNNHLWKTTKTSKHRLGTLTQSANAETPLQSGRTNHPYVNAAIGLKPPIAPIFVTQTSPLWVQHNLTMSNPTLTTTPTTPPLSNELTIHSTNLTVAWRLWDEHNSILKLPDNSPECSIFLRDCLITQFHPIPHPIQQWRQCYLDLKQYT